MDLLVDELNTHKVIIHKEDQMAVPHRNGQQSFENNIFHDLGFSAS